MREPKPVLVTNTTPLIALTAATGNLDILQFLYARVVVPLEVAEEVRVGGKQSFGLDVTGSVGILLKARRLGFEVSIAQALQRMQAQGIWLSDPVVKFALAQVE